MDTKLKFSQSSIVVILRKSLKSHWEVRKMQENLNKTQKEETKPSSVIPLRPELSIKITKHDFPSLNTRNLNERWFQFQRNMSHRA